MDFISLELSRPGEPEHENDPVELIEQLKILIRGIALHAIESQPEELAVFQRGTSEIAASLNLNDSPDGLLAAIGKTLRLTESYNLRATVTLKGQIEELREMMATMTETLQFIISSSETGVKQLGFMESQLQRAGSLQDMRQLKTYASACLSLVRRESARLQVETRSKVETLKNDVERLTVRLKAASVEKSIDPVTGMPGREAAEQAIEDKLSAGREFVAALFHLDQLSSINGRLGRPVGDEIVVSCAHMLAKKLSGAKLYRWSGPVFVAVFDSSVSGMDAENRASEAGAEQLEKNIEADDRLVLVVSAVSSRVLNISPLKMTPDSIFKAMDSSFEAGARA